MLLRRHEARSPGGARPQQPLGGLCAGPRHWRQLPGTRTGLAERCASVQGVLRQGRQLGRFSLAPTDEEVVEADLRRIGSSVKKGSLAVPASLSLLNHSCCPNAEVLFDGPEVILRCLLPLAEGDEVCVSYVDELEDVLARRYSLLEHQGFRCLCPRCQANFCGVGGAALGGWRCTCGAALRDDAIVCGGCGHEVAPSHRLERERRHCSALRHAEQAARCARAAASPASEGQDGLARAAALLEGALAEERALRPAGSVWLVRLQGALCRVLSRLGGAGGAAAAAAADLCALRSAQRRVLAEEAAGWPPAAAPAPEEAAWARRLVAALRLHEAPGASGGRKRRVGPPQDSAGEERYKANSSSIGDPCPRDGGYVVWDAGRRPLCGLLLSYGVDTNVDFELELAEGGARVFLYDHTVPGPPRQHPNFTFVREALAGRDVPGVAGTLASHAAGAGACAGGATAEVMLKVDVEGAEFEAILATSPEVLGRFSQICMELHWLGRPSRGGSFQTKALALERLAERFVLLHAHGNSYGDVVELAGCPVPDVLEVLFVNRRAFGGAEPPRPSSGGIPDEALDVNNCAFVPDICLAGPPFGADLPPPGGAAA
ncbi:unnamed protein product [Prorocentrum cordatum]|uniref:SET domain-containing protein n=1 Tax=Prorocentrum cordatum TaxID=2364126 RepID=A0ABN9WM16_9DINO|nr:unnamed protein product [Polarella glacialis]